MSHLPHRHPATLPLLLLLAAVATPMAAQRPEKPRSQKHETGVVVVFRTGDRGVFRDYFRAHRITGKPLPPGIARNLVRGKPLPPGITRTRVPEEILVRLPARPSGYEVVIVGDRVVMLDRGGLVVDIMLDIF